MTRDTTSRRLSVAARVADDTAVDVRRRLDRLRVLLSGLEPGRIGVSRGRYQALMLGYEAYAQMLQDALAEVATDLHTRAGAVDGEAR